MVRLVIPLSPATTDALARLTSNEFREPRMQAKLILERELARAHALPVEEQDDTDTRPAAAVEAVTT